MRGNDPFLAIPLSMAWTEYQHAGVAHKMPFIPAELPPAGVAVRTDKGDFACGVCLYPTQYRLVIAEFLVTNPEIPLWERHQAVMVCARAVRDYSVCAGLDLWMPVRLQGVKRALERAGFKSRGTEVYGIGR